jgi:hypothetical protein
MQYTLIIALLSALFVATHIGMVTARIRAWMVSRLGENRGCVSSIRTSARLLCGSSIRRRRRPRPGCNAGNSMGVDRRHCSRNNPDGRQPCRLPRLAFQCPRA